MIKQPAVYILANRRLGTLYIGVTSNLIGRIWRHRQAVVAGFASNYGVKKLVWFELADCMASAIFREKQLKKWNREWKVRLIEERNPEWRALWPDVSGAIAVRGFPPSRE